MSTHSTKTDVEQTIEEINFFLLMGGLDMQLQPH